MSIAKRRWPAFALAVYMGLLLYGSLTPFHFSWPRARDLGISGRRIEWIPFTYICPRYGRFCPWDRGVNIAIFLPVGALVAFLLAERRRGSGTIGLATASGLAISLAIETAQLFIPSRFPSTADVLCNGLGTWIGAFSAASLADRLRRIGEARGARQSEPRSGLP